MHFPFPLYFTHRLLEQGLSQEAGSGGVSLFQVFFPFLLIFFIFYLLIWRPNRRQQKALQRLRESLKNGDRIVTSGGIHGTVVSVDEQTVKLRVADGIKIEVAKSAIASLQKSKQQGK